VGKGLPARDADNLTAICGSLDLSQHYGPSRPVTGIALPLQGDYVKSDFSVHDKPENVIYSSFVIWEK
jgi:hypothetical protein